MSLNVQTRYGVVRGIEKDGVSMWRGIPFAKPPVGEMRFRAPEPPTIWSGVRDATHYGPGGFQVGTSEILKFVGVPPDQQHEDCLTLNIWSPAADTRRRPVFVWIYGGSFNKGGGSLPIYDGTSFAQHGDIVVVTFNYRVGPFGFLYLNHLGGKDYEGSGNAGLLDQVALLAWVHDNIANFGGDRDRVTVAGESAGAISINALLSMPRTRHLFQQAILQSGVGLPWHRAKTAEQITQQLLDRLGIPSDIDKLNRLPALEILRAGKDLPWAPVQDESVLTRSCWPAVAPADRNISVMVGYNRHEFRYFMNPEWQQLDNASMKKQFESTLAGPIDPEAAEFFLDRAAGSDLYAGLAELATSKLFMSPVHLFAARQARHDPVWVYRFDWESTTHGRHLKACHALELPFVFNTLNVPGVREFTGETPQQQQLAQLIHNAWISFVRTGNPNTEEFPLWPSYAAPDRACLIFDSDIHVEKDPDRTNRTFWEMLWQRTTNSW